jgi:hypothetical protein
MITALDHPIAAASERRAAWRCWSIVIASAAVVAAAVFPFTAKPIRWDEWVYMGLAFHPEPSAWVLNRYAHVYALKPFMWLAGDPYVGARLYWSAVLGVTVGALIWLTLQLPAERASVLLLTLFLLIGQQAVFAYPGVAYADYTIMALLTVASVLALARIANGADLSRRDAALLGALFLIGVRAKETALPLLCLAALLFITPSGQLRDRREAQRLAVAWSTGMAAAMLALMTVDAVLLRDPLFSLRPSSWRKLLAYNARPYESDPGPHSWLSLMLQPESFVSFALYLGAGLLWSTRERDRRFLIVYALPALFLLQLVLGGTFAVVVVTQRYVVAILPILCLLAALAYVRVVRDAGGARSGLAPTLLVGAPLALGLATTAVAASVSADAMRLSIAPALIAMSFIALLFLRWTPRLAAAVATLAIAVSGTFPLLRVVDDLIARKVQREGEARFAGFYQVARAVRADPDAVVFVSRNLYGGAIRPGVTAAVTRMNFNVRFKTRPIVTDPWPPPPHADYAVVSFDEYQQWLAGAQAEPARAIVSDDREVALICLQAACPRQ